MVRRKMVEQIGPLDENFFLWFEEVNFCRRAFLNNWSICYYPHAQVIHQGAASFNQIVPLKRQRIFNRSLRYYARKHFSYGAYLVLLLLEPVSLFLSFLVQLFKLKRKTYE
jgi:hypothetical protein